MDWRDEGILLSIRRHGETAAIIDVLTRDHGRHSGIVQGGGGRRMAPVLQPGTHLSLEWTARLEDHLGTYRVDPIRQSAGLLMADRAALATLGAIAALICVSLPEREAHPALYARSLDLLNALSDRPDWPALYALWETALLRDLGFGLDLETCAATGSREDLIYVSPRSGRAVSGAAGAPWAAKMLPLPGFLRDEAAMPGPADVIDALRLTEFFLEARLAPTLPREVLPDARARAVEAIRRKLRRQSDAGP